MGARRFRIDTIALGALLFGFLMLASLVSYDPADPPFPTVHPARSNSNNLLGYPGAWLAALLQETLGSAAYGLLAAWFVLTLILFLRRDWVRWISRLTGWLMLTFAGATWLAASQAPFGHGGTIGASSYSWLQRSLSGIERSVAGVAWLGIACVMVLDFVLVPIACAAWRAVLVILSYEPPAPREASKLPEQTSKPIPIAEPLATGIPIRHHDVSVDVAPVPDLSIIPKAVPIRRSQADLECERYADFELPPLSLLEEPQPFPYAEHDQLLRDRAALLEKTFADFGLNVRVVGINTGPVITQYEVALETGLRVNKVTGLGDDLALNLKVSSVRIVAPIPGKNTVGIEVPNEKRAVVRLKEVILTSAKKTSNSKIPLFLGKDTEGFPLVYDLAEMPHLLIAGRTGTGKSVCMNAIILSVLMTRRPDEVKMIMIDPKMLEMSEYGRIPHLMHPVVKDMKKAEAILSWAVDKMEERYDLLSRARVRNVASYNELTRDEVLRRVQPEAEEEERIPEKMPYIIIFVDEMNDLMMMMKKEVEGHIIRLAQKSRAAGIHLVVATQKPTVDVITGLIKSNLPARICFQVSSRTDSRVVLDEMGAEKLLGKGDMLFLQPGTSTVVRAQGTYASDEEITRVVGQLECDPCFAEELVQLSTERREGGSFLEHIRARDDVYEQAIEVVVREGRGSVSLLQRALGIGYGRAARLIDFMAEDGIVGTYNGSQAREVLYTPEQWGDAKQCGQPA